MSSTSKLENPGSICFLVTMETDRQCRETGSTEHPSHNIEKFQFTCNYLMPYPHRMKYSSSVFLTCLLFTLPEEWLWGKYNYKAAKSLADMGDEVRLSTAGLKWHRLFDYTRNLTAKYRNISI